MSTSSNESHRPYPGALNNTSSIRDAYGSHPSHQMPPEHMHHYQPGPPSWQPSISDMGHHHDSTLARSGPGLPSDILYTSNPPPSLLAQSPSIVPPMSSTSWHPNGGGATSAYQTATSSQYLVPSNPAVESSFSPSYNFTIADEPEDSTPLTGPPIPANVNGYEMIPMIPFEQTDLVHHYLSSVLPIQYLLADSSIYNFMFKLLQTSPSARDAACMLSALHMQCVRYPPRSNNNELVTIFRRIQDNLTTRRSYTEGDAMAGLHLVSSFLFSGGRGSWATYLDIASQYVENILNNPRYYGPEDVLKNCSESTRFIIKTTMWFDVLASVTTLQIPRFLEVYRLLFGRATAYIDDPVSTAPEFSMLPVMGCENHIVLAIAEISNLAHWKEGQRRRGCLSVPQLVERGIDIENKYLLPAQNVPYPPPDTHGPMAAADAEIATRRRLTNDIFRASARVYLHTVLSGDHPLCPEIVNGVTETIDALRRVPTHIPSVSRGVVRSVVFGICICGCLTDDHRQRTFLLKMLETQQGESVGNLSEVRALMEQVWTRRDNGQGRPVNWRDVMRESQRDLLLLV
ncbi:hypothetical protein OBBRIDRAFT_790624 [Obba rivulosa]|uniref:Uncharacterized protein n=1 Tax=Obba rivulosa TaxID=1052685 RepID=A0A8E2B388_9APHY|nr:hypothetical protein OBBRIDRAFT_790624 [Obba rivulosa]